MPVSDAYEDKPSGNLVVVAGNKWDVEVSAQFVSSKAAFASAATISTPTSNNSTCAINGGVDNCFMYTGECGGVGGAVACPPDPNAGPGIISCWCKPPNRLTFPVLSANTSMSFGTELLIDKDRDGKSDEVRASSSRVPAFNLGFVQYYEIIKGAVWRMEWEDLYQPPNGDFDDYVTAVAFKDCDGTPFPPAVGHWPEAALKCMNDCKPDACPTDDESQPDDLRIAAAVLVDPKKGEIDMERRGRMLSLSLAIQSLNSQEMAFCPVLWFKYTPQRPWANSSPNVARDEIAVYEYSSSQTACSQRPPQSGKNGLEPVCLSKETTDQRFPVSLAREQKYKPDACFATGNPRVGPGDTIVLENGSSCGASSTLLDFELALAEVDAQLSSASTEALAERTADQLLLDPDYFLERIELFVVDKLAPQFQGAPFHCPSGVNVRFGGADASMGRVRKFDLWNDLGGTCASVPGATGCFRGAERKR